MRISASDDDHYPRCLDTMLIVYGLLGTHPARDACQALVSRQSGWLAFPPTILEAYHILVRVYNTPRDDAVAALATLATGPVAILPMTGADPLTGLEYAGTLGVDPTDGAILHACERVGARILATDDARLAAAAEARGFTIENPITAEMRPEIAEWEERNLPEKGLPRVLRSVDLWLTRQAPELSPAFRSATGGYSHLP